MTRALPLLIVVVLSGLAFPRGLRAEDAETAARRGTRLYEEGRYEEAVEAFRRARELAQEKGETPPTFDYNLGTTYARQGEFDRALESLREAASAPEPEETPTVRERAFYNLGVSAARKGEALRRQGESQLNAEYETLQQALDAFRQSLILDPSDENARHNYALTQRRLDEIESMMQQQQQDQQGEGEPSDQQQSEGGQEEQDSQSGEDQSGEGEHQQSSDPSSGSGESLETQEPPPQPQDPSGQEQDRSSPSDSAEEGESGQPQRTPSESDDAQRRETEDPYASREREGERPPPEKEQRGGLEATPTPTPERSPGDAEPQRSEGARERPENSANRPGAAGGAESTEELTPEQLDALRVLNSLEEGQPEQFKKLFRFRGGGEGRDLERDW